MKTIDDALPAPARGTAPVAVIVPVYNAGPAWPRALDALVALDPAPAELLVVDDGSTDDSAAQALARGLTVLHTPRPRSGPAAARNLAAACANSPILFFADADVLLPPDAVRHVARALALPGAPDALFGSYDEAPADPGFLSQYKNLLHHYVHQASSGHATTFWAGCGAIRRATFQQLGGFSLAYARPSIEDIELGNRLARAGGRILLDKSLQVKHLKRWTWRSLLVTDIRDRALPWAGLILRAGRLPSDLNLQPSHRFSAALCWLLLAALAAAPMWPLPALVVVLALVLSLIALNRGLYEFFLVRRGLWFTLRAIPLHWLYYLYSSGAFAYVLLRRAIAGPAPAPGSARTS